MSRTDTSQATTDEPVVMYSDYVCPFCYLEHRSLKPDDETRERVLDVEWHPYDLRSERRDPDGDLDEGAMDYPERVGERIEELKREHGAEEMLSTDDVPRVDSRNAQVASLFVASEHPEQWTAFDDGVFAALWVEGRDISDAGELAAIAETAGIEGEAVRSAVVSDDYRDRLAEKFAEARRSGITDVPTFVSDGDTISGVVSPAELARLVENA
jgi:predicted DsbA family dithiol-disulfide isomerase